MKPVGTWFQQQHAKLIALAANTTVWIINGHQATARGPDLAPGWFARESMTTYTPTRFAAAYAPLRDICLAYNGHDHYTVLVPKLSRRNLARLPATPTSTGRSPGTRRRRTPTPSKPALASRLPGKRTATPAEPPRYPRRGSRLKAGGSHLA